MSDPTQISAQQLLDQADFLRRLARKLTADEHLQEDMVQTAYLQALDSPPRDASALGGWLGTVAKNFARMTWRGDSRRDQRERAAARPDHSPAADWTAERRELLGDLTTAVLALDEPFQTTVLHRFFDDLPPREIAKRMEVPVETVRSRMKRSLVLLREMLDRKYGGDRQAWCIPLLTFASLPKLATIGAPLVATTATACATTASLPIGIAIMKKSILPLTVLLLAGAAFLALNSPANQTVEPLVEQPNTPLAGRAEQPERPLARGKEAPTRRPLQRPTKSASITTKARPGELLIQVVDEKGNPVPGIPVAITYEKNGRQRPTPFRAETSGPAGIARLPRLAARFAKLGLPLPKFPHPFAVSLAFPLAKPVFRQVDLTSLPQEPVRLVTPPTGLVEIKVVDRAGNPTKETAVDVGLSRTRLEPSTGKLLTGRVEFPATAIKGRARCVVGLGLEVAAYCIKRRRGQENEVDDYSIIASSLQTGPGPVEAGQRIEFSLIKPAPQAIITGRVLLPGGRPLTNKSISLDIWRKEIGGRKVGKKSPYGQIKTDDQGRFRLEMDTIDPGLSQRILTLSCPSPVGPKELLTAQCDVTSLAPGGDTEVGDITLGAADLILAGMVVDPSGNPVPKVNLVANTLQSLSNGRAEKREYMRFFKSTFSDERGCFRFTGKTSSPEVRLGANSQDYLLKKDKNFLRGSRDIRIVVIPTGGIAGSLKLRVPVKSRRIVTLEIMDPTQGDKRVARVSNIRFTGPFSTKNIPVGQWDIGLFHEKECLLRIPAVKVEHGKTTTDPRLASIDLSRKLHVHTLEVVSDQGQYLDQAWFYLGPEFTQKDYCSGGEKVLVTTKSTLDLIVGKTGWRPQKFTRVQGKLKVVLTRAFPLQLVLNQDLNLPADGFSLRAYLQQQFKRERGKEYAYADGPWTIKNCFFAANGRAATTMPASGIYQVIWKLQKMKNNGGYYLETIPTAKKYFIKVKPLPGKLQTIGITPPSREIKEAIANFTVK